MEGGAVERWLPEGYTNAPPYRARHETVHVLMKVETHNHPTAISPFPGASTGAGGEIRDEGATGRGSRPKAGLTGFSVSNLHLPGHRHEPWEREPLRRKPRPHIASAAADHDRRPARRRRLQQRVRPAEPGRLLPRLRADGRRPAPRLSQADHDRRRPRRDRGDADAQDRVPGRHAADPARRPGHAHRHGRRRGELDGGRRERRPSSTSIRCSAATPRSSAARRRSSTTARRSASRIRSWRSTTSAPAASRTRSRSWSTAPVAARASTCARCRSRRAASRRRRSGATRARSATCWRSRPTRCRCFDAMCERERCPYAVVGVATEARELQVGAIDLGMPHRRRRPNAACRPDRHADRRAARQAAEDAPRRAPPRRRAAARST